MTPDEMEAAANYLLQLEGEHKAKTGYGSATIRGIANSLQHHSVSAAQCEWHNDGDKLWQYPTLREAVIKILGCRLHSQHNCDNWMCKKVGG